MARRAGSEIIDLSYALESRPEAEVRAPWIEQELGEGHPVELATGPVVVAHPAAVVLGLLLVRLHKQHKIRRANATVLEPASEHGRRGMDELHEQTVKLLSFQQLPTLVFGTQVAFNVCPATAKAPRRRWPRLKIACWTLPAHYQWPRARSFAHACAGSGLPRPHVFHLR